MNHNRHIYNQRVIVCVNKITDNFTLVQKSQFYDVRSEKSGKQILFSMLRHVQAMTSGAHITIRTQTTT